MLILTCRPSLIARRKRPVYRLIADLSDDLAADFLGNRAMSVVGRPLSSEPLRHGAGSRLSQERGEEERNGIVWPPD